MKIDRLLSHLNPFWNRNHSLIYIIRWYEGRIKRRYIIDLVSSWFRHKNNSKTVLCMQTSDLSVFLSIFHWSQWYIYNHHKKLSRSICFSEFSVDFCFPSKMSFAFLQEVTNMKITWNISLTALCWSSSGIQT